MSILVTLANSAGQMSGQNVNPKYTNMYLAGAAAAAAVGKSYQCSGDRVIAGYLPRKVWLVTTCPSWSTSVKGPPMDGVPATAISIRAAVMTRWARWVCVCVVCVVCVLYVCVLACSTLETRSRAKLAYVSSWPFRTQSRRARPHKRPGRGVRFST